MTLPMEASDTSTQDVDTWVKKKISSLAVMIDLKAVSVQG